MVTEELDDPKTRWLAWWGTKLGFRILATDPIRDIRFLRMLPKGLFFTELLVEKNGTAERRVTAYSPKGWKQKMFVMKKSSQKFECQKWTCVDGQGRIYSMGPTEKDFRISVWNKQ